jgi:sigma-B regulation protein RsbU (phosphoserine phosphatase)
MSAVNRTLCSNNDSQMFVTVLAAVLDTDTGVLEYCDAGHEPPFIVSADGSVRMVEKRSGLALGFVPGYEYQRAQIELVPGDAVVFYTDGISEAMNTQREMFGAVRLGRALEHAPEANAETLGTTLIDAVHAFVGDAAQSDDLTLLIVRYVPTPARTGGAVVTVMEAV